nr:hypothetical protein CFP56_09078 [Quercus suber]
MVSDYAADPGVWKVSRPYRRHRRGKAGEWAGQLGYPWHGKRQGNKLEGERTLGSAKARRNHSAKNPVDRVKACVELKFNISGAIEGELQHQNNAASDHTFSINPERSDMSG